MCVYCDGCAQAQSMASKVKYCPFCIVSTRNYLVGKDENFHAHAHIIFLILYHNMDLVLVPIVGRKVITHS